MKLSLGPCRPLVLGAVSLSLYGVAYFAITYLFHIPEAEKVFRKALGTFHK